MGEWQWYVAAERPERVERLVLVDAAGFNLQEKKRPWPLRLVGSAPVAALLDRMPLRRLLVEASLRQVFFDDALVTGERIDEYLEPVLRPEAARAIRSLLASRSLHPDVVQRAPAPDHRPDPHRLGARGPMDPGDGCRPLPAALPGSRVVVLDRCGHMPQEERPAEVARLIADFEGRGAAAAP